MQEGQGKKDLESHWCHPVRWDVDGSPQSSSRGCSESWICSEGRANTISWQTGCRVWEKGRNINGSSVLFLSNWKTRFAINWVVEECIWNRWEKGVPNWTRLIWEALVEVLSKLLNKWSYGLEQKPQLEMNIWELLEFIYHLLPRDLIEWWSQ